MGKRVVIFAPRYGRMFVKNVESQKSFRTDLRRKKNFSKKSKFFLVRVKKRVTFAPAKTNSANVEKGLRPVPKQRRV